MKQLDEWCKQLALFDFEVHNVKITNCILFTLVKSKGNHDR